MYSYELNTVSSFTNATNVCFAPSRHGFHEDAWRMRHNITADCNATYYDALSSELTFLFPQSDRQWQWQRARQYRHKLHTVDWQLALIISCIYNKQVYSGLQHEAPHISTTLHWAFPCYFSLKLCNCLGIDNQLLLLKTGHTWWKMLSHAGCNYAQHASSLYIIMQTGQVKDTERLLVYSIAVFTAIRGNTMKWDTFFHVQRFLHVGEEKRT
jgi:hypothetical protein